MTKEELDKQIDKWLKQLETMKPFIDRKVRLNIRREELLHDMKQLQEDYILNFIKTGISNARVEANNNKISLLVHRSYGFKNFNNMVDLIMLVCSDLDIPLPNRPDKVTKTPILKENPAI